MDINGLHEHLLVELHFHFEGKCQFNKAADGLPHCVTATQ